MHDSLDGRIKYSGLIETAAINIPNQIIGRVSDTILGKFRNPYGSVELTGKSFYLLRVKDENDPEVTIFIFNQNEDIACLAINAALTRNTIEPQ